MLNLKTILFVGLIFCINTIVLKTDARDFKNSSEAVKSIEVSNSGKVVADIVVFVRSGCAYCAKAENYLEKLSQQHSDLKIQVYEISESAENYAKFERLVEAKQLAQAAVPLFVIQTKQGQAQVVLIGFAEAETPGKIETLLGLNDTAVTGQATGLTAFGPQATVAPSTVPALPNWVRLENLGLPLFTIVIGLLDGFNPCAMWVLIFLLSLLTHVPQRGRRFLIAGIFVLSSGVVYYGFMATWFNLFRFMGWSKHLQIFLGLISVVLAVFHLKDAFTEFGGVSLSLSAAEKSKIGARARAIVTAENLPGALVAVVVLAALVNFYELLCTAGLPAIYAQTLSRQNLTGLQQHLYLLLYNVAYIFDDALMVLTSVFVISHSRLSARQGSVLRVLSGLALLAIGLILIFKPEWLVFF